MHSVRILLTLAALHLFVLSCQPVLANTEFGSYTTNDRDKIANRVRTLRLPKIPREEEEFLQAFAEWLISATDLKKKVLVNEPYNPDAINLYVCDARTTDATTCHQGEAVTWNSISLVFIDRNLLEYGIPDYAMRKGFFHWDEWIGRNLFQEQQLLLAFVILHEFGHLSQNSPNLAQHNQRSSSTESTFKSPKEIEEEADDLAFIALKKIYSASEAEKLERLKLVHGPMARAKRPGTDDLYVILNQKVKDNKFAHEFFDMTAFGMAALYDANAENSPIDSDYAHPPLVSRFDRLLKKFSAAEMSGLHLVGPIDFEEFYLPPKGHTLLEISTPQKVASVCWANDDLCFLLADGSFGKFTKAQLKDLFSKNSVQHQRATNFVHYKLTDEIYQMLPPNKGKHDLTILSKSGKIIRIPKTKSIFAVRDITAAFGTSTNFWRDFFQAEDGSDTSAGWLETGERSSSRNPWFTIYLFHGSEIVAQIDSVFLKQELQSHFGSSGQSFHVAGLYSDRLFLTVETGQYDRIQGIVEIELPRCKIKALHRFQGIPDGAGQIFDTGRANLLIRKEGTNVLAFLAEDFFEGREVGFQVSKIASDAPPRQVVRFIPTSSNSIGTHNPSQFDGILRELSFAEQLRFSDPETIWICYHNAGVFRANLKQGSAEFCTMPPSEGNRCAFGPNGCVAYSIGNFVFCFQ